MRYYYYYAVELFGELAGWVAGVGFGVVVGGVDLDRLISAYAAFISSVV